MGKSCEYCSAELNQGTRFCSKDCYKQWRKVSGFRVPNARKFCKGNKPWNIGVIGRKSYMNLSGLTGVKKHTQETIEKMRKKAIGRKHSYETKVKISALQQKLPLNQWLCFSSTKNIMDRKRFQLSMRGVVLARDNYTCQICGEKGCALQVDHIKPWAEYVELRFESRNCRTLCMACHYRITFGREMPKKVRTWGHNFSQIGG